MSGHLERSRSQDWEGLRQGGLTLQAVPLHGSQQLLPQVRASSNLIAVVILWAKYKNLQMDMTWGQMGNSNLAVSGGQSISFKQIHSHRLGVQKMGSSPFSDEAGVIDIRTPNMYRVFISLFEAH